jgi:2',3'-cyclic-nucleotide 2'-phosphodiesterase/3'-nucleotidase
VPGPDAESRQSGVSGAGSGSGVPPPEGGPQSLFRLRILATTDIHAQLLSYDYFANRPQFGMGLAQTASLIAQARAEAPDAILLDNGDFLQGSALAELAAMPGRRTRPHPAITAFNVLGYDAAALGNHEFNYGLGILREAITAARFPVVSANVALELGDHPTGDRLLTRPYALIQRRLTARGGQMRDITVGVLGLTPPEILDWDHGLLAGKIEVRPMIEAARAWVPEMRRAGADLVVCLAHTGITDLTEHDRREGMATEIAAIEGVDAMVAGHSHLVFPNAQLYADPRIDAMAGRLAGKPAVQPGHSGSHLGVIDLTLTHGPFGWKRHEARARAISASEVVAGLSPKTIRAGANPLRAALGADHRSALSWTRRTLGKTLVPLTTYFAQAADSRAMRVLAAAKIAHVAAAIEGRPEALLPIIAGVTPFRTGGRGGPLNFTDIAAGPLSVRHVFDLYPFPNSIVASVATGAQILARLEAGTAVYRMVRPGEQDQPLIDPGTSGFILELFPGLTYQIDLSRPPGVPGRIRDLRFEGRPVERTMRFVVASNSYRLGTHPELAGEVILDGNTPVTSVIAEFLRTSGEIGLPGGPGWSFARLPGTSVIYDSGAAALGHMDEVRELSPRFLGITDEGFHRFRLHL